MPIALDTLVLEFEANFSAFNRGTNEAQRRAVSSAKQLERIYNDTKIRPLVPPKIDLSNIQNFQRRASSAFESVSRSNSSMVSDVIRNQARLVSSLDRVERQMAQVERASKQMGGGFTVAKAALAALAANAGASLFSGAIQGVTALNRGIASAGTESQNLMARLTVLEGSTQAARKAFDQIRQFSNPTNFQIPEVANAYASLRNRNIDPNNRTLTALGDLSNASQKPLQQTIEALLDASAGNFERLEEYGVVAKKNGDSAILTFRGLTQQVQINEKAITSALVRFGEMPGILGATAAAGQTVDGRMSTINDKLSTIGANAFDALLPATNAILDAVSDLINPLSQNKELFDLINGAATEFANELKRNPQVIADIAKSLSEGVLETSKRIIKAISDAYAFYERNHKSINAIAGGTVMVLDKTNEILSILSPWQKGLELILQLYEKIANASLSIVAPQIPGLPQPSRERLAPGDAVPRGFVLPQQPRAVPRLDNLRLDNLPAPRRLDSITVPNPLMGGSAPRRLQDITLPNPLFRPGTPRILPPPPTGPATPPPASSRILPGGSRGASGEDLLERQRKVNEDLAEFRQKQLNELQQTQIEVSRLSRELQTNRWRDKLLSVVGSGNDDIFGQIANNAASLFGQVNQGIAAQSAQQQRALELQQAKLNDNRQLSEILSGGMPLSGLGYRGMVPKRDRSFNSGQPGFDWTAFDRNGKFFDLPIPFPREFEVLRVDQNRGGYGKSMEVRFDFNGQKMEMLIAHLNRLNAALVPGGRYPAGTVLGNQGFTGNTIPRGIGGTHNSTDFFLPGGRPAPEALSRAFLEKVWFPFLSSTQKQLASTPPQLPTTGNQNLDAARALELKLQGQLANQEQLGTLQSINQLPVTSQKALNDALEQQSRTVGNLTQQWEQLSREYKLPSLDLQDSADLQAVANRFKEYSQQVGDEVKALTEKLENAKRVSAGFVSVAGEMASSTDPAIQQLRQSLMASAKLMDQGISVKQKQLQDLKSIQSGLPGAERSALSFTEMQNSMRRREEALRGISFRGNLDTGILNSEAGLRESFGDVFGAAQLRERAAILQENIRLQQELLQIQKDFANQPGLASEFERLARIQSGLNIQGIQRQFLDLEETLIGVGRDGLQQMVEGLITGKREWSNLLESASRTIAGIASQLITSQLMQLFQNGLELGKTPSFNPAPMSGVGGLAASFFGLANGGSVVGNLAGGGPVELGISALRALDKERSLNGGRGVGLYALTDGEEVLNPREASFYRAVRANGIWDDLKSNLGYTPVRNRADGGAVGDYAQVVNQVSSFDRSRSSIVNMNMPIMPSSQGDADILRRIAPEMQAQFQQAITERLLYEKRNGTL